MDNSEEKMILYVFEIGTKAAKRMSKTAFFCYSKDLLNIEVM